MSIQTAAIYAITCSSMGYAPVFGFTHETRKHWESKYAGKCRSGSSKWESKRASPKLNCTGNGYKSKRKKQSR